MATFTGTSGDDLINGTSGADTIEGGAGNDTINGLGGADTITDSVGSDTIDGGGGNDTIAIVRPDAISSNVALQIYGGTGNDYVRLNALSHGSVNVDLGSGDDHLLFQTAPLDQITVTLGDGTDTLEFDAGSNQAGVPHVTDFTAGAAGDIVDLDAFLGTYTDWDGTTNPFTNGLLVLVQSGPDTVLKYLQSAAFDLSTLAIFENTSATDFVAANFSGFDPAGQPRGLTLTGTSGPDALAGGDLNDTLSGLDGNDTLQGNGGDDTLNGGAGDDRLEGGYGTDDLYGGAGNDTLIDGAGQTTMDGGDGDDTFQLITFSGQLPFEPLDSVIGGAGNDTLTIDSVDDIGVIADMGDGNDQITFDNLHLSAVLTLGLGSDVVTFSAAAGVPSQPIYITDFTTGAGGDRLNFVDLADSLTLLPAGENPFAYGIAELVQVGADTRLVVAGHAIATFRNTLVTSFTADNFDVDPQAPLLPGLTITGTSGNDQLTGTIRGDTISGLGGDDLIYGNGHQVGDHISGGGGNDEIYGSGAGDVIDGGGGADTIDGGDGADTITGGLGNDTIVYHDSLDTIDGGDGTDTLDFSNIGVPGDTTQAMNFDFTGYSTTGVFKMAGHDVIGIERLNFFLFGSAYGDSIDFDANATTGISYDSFNGGFDAGNGNDSLYGTAGADYFVGGSGDDTLDGRGGDDYLEGGYNNDHLIGGAGNDNLQGGGNDDVLDGGDGNDELWADVGNDTLVGGIGNDILQAGSGADHAEGGDGDDTITFLGLGAGDSVDGGAGDDTLIVNPAGEEGINLDLRSFWAGGPIKANGANLAISGIEHVEYELTYGNDILLLGEKAPQAVNLNALEGNDTITGTSFADIIDGGAGDDTLNGGGGKDALSDFYGTNVLHGGAGNDNLIGQGTLHGDGGNDIISGHGSLYGDAGNDTIIGSGWLEGGAGDDVIRGQENEDTIAVGANGGIDSIDGGFANDTLLATADGAVFHWTKSVTGSASSAPLVENVEIVSAGGHANATLVGTAQADVLYLSELTIDSAITINALGGNDQVIGTGGDDTIRLGNGTDSAAGGDGNDHLFGEGGKDSLDGAAGNDALDGGAGDDLLQGGLGDDTMTGGDGTDTVTYVGLGGGVTVALSVTAAQNTGAAGIDTLAAIENLVGTDFADKLTGNAGDNVLDGGLGADTLAGGAGNDSYAVDDAGDKVTEGVGKGTDQVSTALAAYNLAANVENLVGSSDTGQALKGNGLDNRIAAGSGNDTLDGGAGADTMIGGAGNDAYTVDNAGDVVTEAAGQGTDAVATTLASYTLGANVEILFGGTDTGQVLTGNSLVNVIAGGGGNDTIDGGGGSDGLAGGAGADRIDGGAGADALEGDAGADRFVFARASDTSNAARDEIEDFTHAQHDLIDLSGIDAVAGGSDNAFAIVGSFTHHAGQLVIHTAETGHYVVLGDTNGDGTADFGIDVYSATALSAGDFVL